MSECGCPAPATDPAMSDASASRRGRSLELAERNRASAGDVDDGGAGDAVVGQVGERPVGLLERVAGHRRAQRDLGGDGEELLAVAGGCWR